MKSVLDFSTIIADVITGKCPNVLARNASWPDNPRSAARRAAQDLEAQIVQTYKFLRCSQITCPKFIRHLESSNKCILSEFF